MPHCGAEGPELARKEDAGQTNLQTTINAPPPDTLQFAVFDALLKFYQEKNWGMALSSGGMSYSRP